MRHELKTWRRYFDPVWRGAKPFEIRSNDRGFQVGDELWLRETKDDTEHYTGREVIVTITYVLNFTELFNEPPEKTVALVGEIAILGFEPPPYTRLRQKLAQIERMLDPECMPIRLPPTTPRDCGSLPEPWARPASSSFGRMRSRDGRP